MIDPRFPTLYQPETPHEMIGDALRHGIELWNKATAVADHPSAYFRAIFYGDPGVGKTELCKLIGMKLAGDAFAIEQLNGQSVSVDKVRDWSRSAPYRPMFGTGWTVKIIDEFDRMSDAAIFEMHSLLDKRQPRSAFLMTTNMPFAKIPKPFHSRANIYKFTPVSSEELGQFISTHWPVLEEKADIIAIANQGNVRGALFDAEAEIDKINAELAVA